MDARSADQPSVGAPQIKSAINPDADASFRVFHVERVIFSSPAQGCTSTRASLVSLKNFARKAGFVLPLLTPLLLLVGFFKGGFWNSLTLLFLFGVVPLIDLVVGGDAAAPLASNQKGAFPQRFFTAILYMWAVLQLAIVLWGAAVYPSLTDYPSLILFPLSVGAMAGSIGIVVAHEFGHRPGPLNRAIAQIMLITICYQHFIFEHYQGHHVRVATADDPATARAGESFFAFFPRSVLSGLQHAWHLAPLEASRRQSPRATSNPVLWGAACSLAFGTVLALAFGASAFIFFVCQALFAVLVIELGNYIEHYGLVRKIDSDGKLEAIRAVHSWNSNQPVTTWFTLNLQRHSQHHVRAGSRYELLAPLEGAPMLPSSFAAMALLALVPPLWFRVMNPRVEVAMLDRSKAC